MAAERSLLPVLRALLIPDDTRKALTLSGNRFLFAAQARNYQPRLTPASCGVPLPLWRSCREQMPLGETCPASVATVVRDFITALGVLHERGVAHAGLSCERLYVDCSSNPQGCTHPQFAGMLVDLEELHLVDVDGATPPKPPPEAFVSPARCAYLEGRALGYSPFEDDWYAASQIVLRVREMLPDWDDLWPKAAANMGTAQRPE